MFQATNLRESYEQSVAGLPSVKWGNMSESVVLLMHASSAQSVRMGRSRRVLKDLQARMDPKTNTAELVHSHRADKPWVGIPR